MEESGTSRATMYRYFKSLDPIAFEIQKRMIDEIMSDFAGHSFSGLNASEAGRQGLSIMVENFKDHIDAYNYLSIFDHFYASDYPDENYERDYVEYLAKKFYREGSSREHQGEWERMLICGDVVFSFLQKLAHRVKKGRGGVNVDAELKIAGEIINRIF